MNEQYAGDLDRNFGHTRETNRNTPSTIAEVVSTGLNGKPHLKKLFPKRNPPVILAKKGFG